MERKYDQVIRFVQETPWAVKPEMLWTIRGIVAARLEGLELEPVAAKPRQKKNSTPGGIGVLPLWGVILPHASLMSNISGGVAMDTWINEFRSMVDDPAISTIILDIDSPGGAVAMVPEAAAEIRAATGRKRIIAVANPEIASAAYWLASQASEIVMPKSAMVGSIGVIAEHTDSSQMEAMEGITKTYITAGEHKAEQIGPLSDEARAEVQNKVDQMYGMFVADVAKGRGVPVKTVIDAYGKGRMLTASDALSAGMVDRIGTLDTVIAKEMPGASRIRAESDSVELAGFGQTGPNSPVILPVAAGTSYFPTGTLTAGDTSVTINTTTSATSPGFSGTVLFDVDNQVEGDSKENEETMGTASRGAENEIPKEGMMDERLTLEQLAARRSEITARMRELHAEAQGRRFYEEEQREFDGCETEQRDLTSAMENIKEREARLASVVGNSDHTVSGDGTSQVTPPRRGGRGGVYTNSNVRLPENLYDLTAYRGYGSSVEELNVLYREAAKRVIDVAPFETEDLAAVQTRASRLLDRDKDGIFATRLLTAGSSLYDRAFGKMMMAKPLSSQEDAAIKAAVSNTGLGSETPVPVTIDPTVILTSDGAINPLRQLARNVTITGNKWQGISSDGVDVAYEAELTQVSDQTPTFDAPSATVAKAHAYVEFSIEVDQDWGELRSNLAIMFQDAKDMKEANKFLFGTGTNEPEGLLYSLINDATSIVYTATLNTFDVADLYTLKGSLAPRFRSNASWLANDTVYSVTRQFDTAGGSSLWAQLGADRPAVLLGRPLYEASEMSGEVDTGNEEIMVYGDFGRGFIIVDRVGMNVELIPHVMGANRRPIGARALYAYFRNTSALLTPNAFRVLTVKPT